MATLSINNKNWRRTLEATTGGSTTNNSFKYHKYSQNITNAQQMSL